MDSVGAVLKHSEWQLKVHYESTSSSVPDTDVRLCKLLHGGARRRRVEENKHYFDFVLLRMLQKNYIAITSIIWTHTWSLFFCRSLAERLSVLGLSLGQDLCIFLTVVCQQNVRPCLWRRCWQIRLAFSLMSVTVVLLRSVIYVCVRFYICVCEIQISKCLQVVTMKLTTMGTTTHFSRLHTCVTSCFAWSPVFLMLPHKKEPHIKTPHSRKFDLLRVTEIRTLLPCWKFQQDFRWQALWWTHSTQHRKAFKSLFLGTRRLFCRGWGERKTLHSSEQHFTQFTYWPCEKRIRATRRGKILEKGHF